jgi:hypothetical protein
MVNVFRIVTVLLMMSVGASAQESNSSQQQAASEKKAEASKPAPPRPEPTMNIRLDLTITDQRGDTPPVSKTVTMTMLDTAYGRIRTSGDVRTPLGFRPVILNVDAEPKVHKDGRIRVNMTIEYRPTALEAESEKSTTPTINETINVLLEDGKPLVISQSADPATDRKVKVEAKATILK